MDVDIRRRLDEGLLCVEQAVIVDWVLGGLREWVVVNPGWRVTVSQGVRYTLSVDLNNMVTGVLFSALFVSPDSVGVLCFGRDCASVPFGYDDVPVGDLVSLMVEGL